MWLAGYILLNDNKTTYKIKLSKVKIPFLLVKSLVNYNKMFVLRDNGFFYKVLFDSYIDNKVVANTYVVLNRGKNIINIEKSYEEFFVIDNDKDIYHIYQGSKATIPNIKGVIDIYSSRNVFAALTTDGKVYIWGNYSHGVRGLGKPSELGTQYITIGTKRFKTPEESLWTWK